MALKVLAQRLPSYLLREGLVKPVAKKVTSSTLSAQHSPDALTLQAQELSQKLQGTVAALGDRVRQLNEENAKLRSFVPIKSDDGVKEAKAFGIGALFATFLVNLVQGASRPGSPAPRAGSPRVIFYIGAGF